MTERENLNFLCNDEAAYIALGMKRFPHLFADEDDLDADRVAEVRARLDELVSRRDGLATGNRAQRRAMKRKR